MPEKSRSATHADDDVAVLSFDQKLKKSGFCAHSSSTGEGIQGTYDADDVLPRRPAVLRPEEMRNEPREADQKKNARRARQASPETSRPERTYERSLAPGLSNCRRRRDWTTGGAAGAQIPARPGAARRREASRRLRLKARPGLPQPRGPPPRGAALEDSSGRRVAEAARAPARLDVLLPRPGGGPASPPAR